MGGRQNRQNYLYIGWSTIASIVKLSYLVVVDFMSTAQQIQCRSSLHRWLEQIANSI